MKLQFHYKAKQTHRPPQRMRSLIAASVMIV